MTKKDIRDPGPFRKRDPRQSRIVNDGKIIIKKPLTLATMTYFQRCLFWAVLIFCFVALFFIVRSMITDDNTIFGGFQLGASKTLWEGTVRYRAYQDFGGPEDSGICEIVAKIRICMTRTGQNVKATYAIYDSQELPRVITGYGSCPVEVHSATDDKYAPSFSGQLDSNGNLNVEWFSFQERSYKSSSNAGNPLNPDDRDQITASISDNTMNFELLYKSVWGSQTIQKNTIITATKVADTC